MPKPYKTREFNYYFSEESEEERYNFKKDFTIFLNILMLKEGKVKKGFSIMVFIYIITIISTITIIYLTYFR